MCNWTFLIIGQLWTKTKRGILLCFLLMFIPLNVIHPELWTWRRETITTFYSTRNFELKELLRSSIIIWCSHVGHYSFGLLDLINGHFHFKWRMLKTKEWLLDLEDTQAKKKMYWLGNEGRLGQEGRLSSLKSTQPQLGGAQLSFTGASKISENFCLCSGSLRTLTLLLGFLSLHNRDHLIWLGLQLSWRCDLPLSHHFCELWSESLHLSSISKFLRWRVIG